MTDVYERDLYGMKYAILKSPFHKKVVTTCAEMLGVPPMQLRRVLIENLDMLMLESLGARYTSWEQHGDQNSEIKREIGYELFTRYIPIISEETMQHALEQAGDSGGTDEAKALLRKQVFEEETS